MWLKIMLFDILFVDGPDARRLLDDCGHKKVRLGSIINLPLLNRKQILHQLISEQENNVELCPSIVLRPNGRSESPQEYYACTDPMMEFGHVASFLDSTSATIDGLIPNLEAVDFERMQGKKEAEVSMMRSREVDRFYKTVVEDYKFEGLVVKDLASPYRFGDRQVCFI
jgi:ATP-dependent DNA ligase